MKYRLRSLPRERLILRKAMVALVWMLPLLLSHGCGTDDSMDHGLNVKSDMGHVFNEEVQMIRSQILESSVLNIIIKNEGVVFDPTVISQPALSLHYVNSLEMATNIGVYIADLNYLFANNEDESRRQFLDAIFYLAEKLDVENAFDKRRFDVLLSDGLLTQKEKIDFLKILVSEAESKINTDKRAQLVSLIISGSWIEGMYINFSVSKDAWPNEIIGNEMLNHLESFDKIKAILSHFDDYQPCVDRLEDLKKIEPMIRMIQKGDVLEINDNIEEINDMLGAIRYSLIKP